MYSPGGCAYIYLCYGMHEMLNIVTWYTGSFDQTCADVIEGCTALLKSLHEGKTSGQIGGGN